jgi:hypothetical protein
MRDLARRVRLTAVLLALAALLTGAPAPAGGAQNQREEKRVNPNAKAIAEFQEEVEEYVELHRKLEATLPDLPVEATPQQIDERQRALGALVQTARRGAKQGDIFEREVRPVIRKLLAGLFLGPDGKRLRSTINEENPGEVVKLTVNARYPDTIPISTVPPKVLSLLPPLPPELEYRFIGTTLILLDSHAHIIVDYLPAAVPR